ncbi:hypothetical protein [Thermosyntropha sp.]|uniref:hypothetical protein n=1 Tax=Thermosyntropha sp. TaxID=2740820 RepID=UPI0025F2C382|nr:hypothetical protein [Thermosyntropha sp.]MBO8159705.1 hypothetical protein [Thermosyntropha sp.]
MLIASELNIAKPFLVIIRRLKSFSIFCLEILDGYTEIRAYWSSGRKTMLKHLKNEREKIYRSGKNAIKIPVMNSLRHMNR